nr:hypothetical protein [Tanacetum cinerariifolium]
MSAVYSPPPSVRVPSIPLRIRISSKHVYAVKHPKEALCRGYPARHGGRFRGVQNCYSFYLVLFVDVDPLPSNITTGRLSADESETMGSFLSLKE